MSYLIVSFLLACGSSDFIDDQGKNEILSDVLQLELTFGDKDLPDEYLLARPGGIAVNDNGDILVVDENRVKVYSNNGREKSIIGGPGEGPGYFERYESQSERFFLEEIENSKK